MSSQNPCCGVASIPSRISPLSSGRLAAWLARGIWAWNPAAIAGVTIMKMIKSTSITSIIGVTLMSALTAPPDPESLLADRATGLRRFLRLEFLGEDRAPELRAHALDQEVDQLLGGVRHFHGDVVDLGREVVVEPHRRNRDHQTERRGDERFGHAARDRGQ